MFETNERWSHHRDQNRVFFLLPRGNDVHSSMHSVSPLEKRARVTMIRHDKVHHMYRHTRAHAPFLSPASSSSCPSPPVRLLRWLRAHTPERRHGRSMAGGQVPCLRVTRHRDGAQDRLRRTHRLFCPHGGRQGLSTLLYRWRIQNEDGHRTIVCGPSDDKLRHKSAVLTAWK